MTRRIAPRGRTPVAGRACALAIAACAVLVAACGSDARPGGSPALGPARLQALTTELARVAPQGRVTAGQSAAASRRQAAVATSYARKLPAGTCRASLEALSTSYTTYGRAATTYAGNSTNAESYGRAAGAVGTALAAVEHACR